MSGIRLAEEAGKKAENREFYLVSAVVQGASEGAKSPWISFEYSGTVDGDSMGGLTHNGSLAEAQALKGQSIEVLQRGHQSFGARTLEGVVIADSIERFKDLTLEEIEEAQQMLYE